MPQSLAKLYVHVIFSTKNRQPVIDHEIEKTLHSYLGGICNRLECFAVKIGGHKEPVHILSHFSKKITLIKFVEELKSHSSNWIKTQDARYGAFIGKVGMVRFRWVRNTWSL